MSKVKVICVHLCESDNNGNIYFNGVILRITCFYSLLLDPHAVLNFINFISLFTPTLVNVVKLAETMHYHSVVPTPLQIICAKWYPQKVDELDFNQNLEACTPGISKFS